MRKSFFQENCIENLKQNAIELIEKIRNTRPLVHNVTNFVAMNFTANILLAIGASPVMAHCREEVTDMVSLADALVLNIGTLQPDWADSMIAAGIAANQLNIPVILDPVGAGATTFRSENVLRILNNVKVAVIKGNAGEISALAGGIGRVRGVDSMVGPQGLPQEKTRGIAQANNCIVTVSGAVDFVTDGENDLFVENGHPVMDLVTGTGCGLSAVTAAFCSVAEANFLLAAATACGVYGLAAEKAAVKSSLPGSFVPAFIDALNSLTHKDIMGKLKVNHSEARPDSGDSTSSG